MNVQSVEGGVYSWCEKGEDTPTEVVGLITYMGLLADAVCAYSPHQFMFSQIIMYNYVGRKSDDKRKLSKDQV